MEAMRWRKKLRRWLRIFSARQITVHSSRALQFARRDFAEKFRSSERSPSGSFSTFLWGEISWPNGQLRRKRICAMSSAAKENSTNPSIHVMKKPIGTNENGSYTFTADHSATIGSRHPDSLLSEISRRFSSVFRRPVRAARHRSFATIAAAAVLALTSG